VCFRNLLWSFFLSVYVQGAAVTFQSLRLCTTCTEIPVTAPANPPKTPATSKDLLSLETPSIPPQQDISPFNPFSPLPPFAPLPPGIHPHPQPQKATSTRAPRPTQRH